MYQITALTNSIGPTIDGLTDMQSGKSYVVMDEDVAYYRRHPDAFSVGEQIYALAAYGTNANGSVSLMGPSANYKLATQMHVMSVLERAGVVGSPTVDDAAAFQDALDILAADYGGAVPISHELSYLRIDSGITLDAAKHFLRPDGRLHIDAAGVTTGAAITVSGSITAGTAAALQNGLNGISRVKLTGAGSPSVAGAAGVIGIKFRGTGGKGYFYRTQGLVVDGFEANVDLAGNSFGILFDHLFARAAMGGTIVQALTGDGSDYGENYHFLGGWLGNSARALHCTHPNSTFNFSMTSLDYNGVMMDMEAGTAAGLIYCETNGDVDYLFKCRNSETAAITLAPGSVITLNGVNRTNYELFYSDSAVKFGGISAPDLRITHGSGYSLATYGAGPGRISLPRLRSYTNETKIPVSAWMSSILPGSTTASLAEWTLSGTPTPAVDAVERHNSAPTFKIAAQSGAASMERTFACGVDQHPRLSFYYKKSGSSAGQALLQLRGFWFDSKGTQVGSTITIDDIDGNVDWTLKRCSINTPRPQGAVSFKFRLVKSADAGAAGIIWLADFIGGPM